MRVPASALIFAPALFAAGCVEIHEEVRVQEDGSVRYTLEYGLPDYVVATMEQMGPADPADTTDWMFFGRARAGVVDGDSAWTRDYLEGDWRYLVTERAVSSLATLEALSGAMERDLERDGSAQQDTTGAARRDAMGMVLSGYEVEPVGAGRLRVRRLVFPRDIRSGIQSFAKAPLRAEEPSPEATKRIFAGRTYRLRVTAPRIVSSNGAISADRTSVTWVMPMAEASEDSTRTLEAILDLSAPRR